ncbi:MAG: hypothetical protein KC983_09450, partial [Phycisphaerales bacterium]|nr:hypothetical protein [Phycisphaerales bacterium]
VDAMAQQMIREVSERYQNAVQAEIHCADVHAQILTLLREHRGDWRVDNGRLSFGDDDVEAAFRALVSDIQAHARPEFSHGILNTPQAFSR